MSFRDLVSGPTLSPPWLVGHGSNAERFMYAIGLALDALIEKHNEGELAKCPGFGPTSALPYMAADRQLVQGPAEDNTVFALRLEDAFNAWRRAGSRPAIIGQLQAYLTGTQPGVAAGLPAITIVGSTSAITSWDWTNTGDPQGVTPNHRQVAPPNWNWEDGNQPTRAWLVLYQHLVPTGQSGTTARYDTAPTGSGVPGVTDGFALIKNLSGVTSNDVGRYITISGADIAGNNGTFQITTVVDDTSIIIANPLGDDGELNNNHLVWSIAFYPFIAPGPVLGSPQAVLDSTNGLGLASDSLEVDSIRGILRQWKAAQTFYVSIIIAYGGGDGTAGNDFSPLSSEGAGNPDSTWGFLGKNVNNVWVPAATPGNAFTVFCSGTGQYVNCNVINVT